MTAREPVTTEELEAMLAEIGQARRAAEADAAAWHAELTADGWKPAPPYAGIPDGRDVERRAEQAREDGRL